MKLNAYAKINLILNVLGTRPDGYHEVEMLMQAISLCDLVTVKVADGDTITVLASNVQHKVRLSGIDAPEKRQAFGEASRRHLASLVAGKDVKVEWTNKDRYGRILGIVWASVPADGTEVTPCVDVNLRMIQDGFAWHYSNFDNTQSYADAEAAARTAKR